MMSIKKEELKEALQFMREQGLAIECADFYVLKNGEFEMTNIKVKSVPLTIEAGGIKIQNILCEHRKGDLLKKDPLEGGQQNQ